MPTRLFPPLARRAHIESCQPSGVARLGTPTARVWVTGPPSVSPTKSALVQRAPASQANYPSAWLGASDSSAAWSPQQNFTRADVRVTKAHVSLPVGGVFLLEQTVKYRISRHQVGAPTSPPVPTGLAKGPSMERPTFWATSTGRRSAIAAKARRPRNAALQARASLEQGAPHRTCLSLPSPAEGWLPVVIVFNSIT